MPLSRIIPIDENDFIGYRPNNSTNSTSVELARASTESMPSENNGDDAPLLRTPHPQYADIELLRRWFPAIDPESHKANTISWRLSRRPIALVLQLLLTFSTLAFNIGVTAYAWLRYSDSGDTNATTIFTGNCDAVTWLGSIAHLIINLLSTGLLGASNYCMQILAAPTRAEIDESHAKQQWFDIGIASPRNLWKVRRVRAVMFLLLGASSAILHLLWNSAVFSSFPFISYRTAYVTSDFWDNTISWNVTNPIVAQMQYDAKHSYEHLNNTECIERYMDPSSGAGNVVVVTKWHNNNVTQNDSSSLIENFTQGPTSNWDRMGAWTYHSPAYPDPPYSLQRLLPYAHNWSVGVKDRWVAPVEYCLSQGLIDMDDLCGLHFNKPIMIVVCIMNFFKVLLIGYTWIGSLRTVISRTNRGGKMADNEPLVTIGDSMQSFLNRNDVHTRDMCLASHTDFKPKCWERNQKPESRQWEGKLVLRKFRMASKRDWVATISACTAMMIIVLALLIRTISQQQGEGSSTSFKALWEEGIGRAHPMEIVQIFASRGSSQFWGTVFFANSWQLEISILYFLYNTLLTRLCVAVEWSHFGTKNGDDKDSHKFLRISAPSGMQRSTYFLSLPFRYSIPLATALLLLHWLVSQSVFIARASAFLPNREPDDAYSSSRVGYSSIGVIFCLIVGSILILMLIAIGFQKTEFRLPFVSTCSAAISAACHQPEDDQDAALLPIKWGDIINPRENTAKPGHCSLTTLWDVKEPVRGKFYQ